MEYNRGGFIIASGRHLVLKGLNASDPTRGKNIGATDELSSANVSGYTGHHVASQYIIRLLEQGEMIREDMCGFDLGICQ
jgi:hypothetical protein